MRTFSTDDGELVVAEGSIPLVLPPKMKEGDTMSSGHGMYAVCNTHKNALAYLAEAGHLRFYAIDNTPVFGTYTLCSAHVTGCTEPAVAKFEYTEFEYTEMIDRS